MFDFLHLPDLTDGYLRSLIFMAAIVLAFFGGDYWLLTKDPTNHRKDIKLADFFITRLRVFIPLTFWEVILTITAGKASDPSLSLNTCMLSGIVFTAFSFYFSAFLHFLLPKTRNLPLEFWLVLFSSFGVATFSMDKFPFTTLGCMLIFLLVLMLIFAKLNSNKNTK